MAIDQVSKDIVYIAVDKYEKGNVQLEVGTEVEEGIFPDGTAHFCVRTSSCIKFLDGRDEG
eukprot:15349730-Ditylum_brightwellii.AAC.1